MDRALESSCKRGALESVKVFLKYRSDISMPGGRDPLLCLLLAAQSGYGPLVKLLLDNGVSLEEPACIRCKTLRSMSQKTDALAEARRRNYPEIVKLIEERKRALAASGALFNISNYNRNKKISDCTLMVHRECCP